MRFRDRIKFRLRINEHVRDLERKAGAIVFLGIMAAVTIGIVLFKLFGG